MYLFFLHFFKRLILLTYNTNNSLVLNNSVLHFVFSRHEETQSTAERLGVKSHHIFRLLITYLYYNASKCGVKWFLLTVP